MISHSIRNVFAEESIFEGFIIVDLGRLNDHHSRFYLALLATALKLIAAESNPSSRVRPARITAAARAADHDRWTPLLRLAISFSQGAEWKALIRMYIQTMLLSGDASCAAAQSTSWAPSPRTPVISAIIAKVGVAARHTQLAAPRAADAGHASGVPSACVVMALNSSPPAVLR
jgi:hypothetical protein